MSGLNSLVDYNPIALATNKLFNWSSLFSDLSKFFGGLLFHNAPARV